MSEPLDALLEQRGELREQYRKANKKLKELKHEMEELDERIINTMHVVGTDIARSDHFTATVVEETRFNVQDFDQLINWVAEAPLERAYLFERRLSQQAIQEYLDLEQTPIPGTGKFIRDKLHFRRR